MQTTQYINRQVAIALASVLTPASLMAMVLGFWRLGSDLNITGAFAISRGVFSHWQVWIALAIVMQAVAIVLGRVGQREEYSSDDATI